MRYDVALLAPGVSGKARAAERGRPRSRSVTRHGASGASNPEGAGGQAPAILRHSRFLGARLRGMTTLHARCLVLPRLGRRCAALSYDDTP